MVNQPRRDESARGRLLAAAATEFAARGFDGATVDRIAAAARANKALVYYYFKSKAGLYREILRDLIGAAADAIDAVRATGGPADRQLGAFIAALGREAAARPHFPAIWLREMADGGRHLDDAVIAQARRVISALSGILAEGRDAGLFREAHPFLTHLGIVAPLMMFLASGPVRARFQRHLPAALTNIPPEAMLRHLEISVLAALAPATTVPSTSTRRLRP
jgi:TetR/AcrR family transcriptional regulator